MSDEQDDSRFEAFLQREAPEYHQPPVAVPRDEMWEVIARARSAARAVAPGSDIAALPTRGRRLRYAPWIGMAATLLIGVGVGRYVLRDNAPSAGIAAVAGSTSTGLTSADPSLEPLVPEGVPETARVNSVDRAVPRAPARTVASREATADVAGSAYAVASRDHLTRAEALVAVVAAMPADAMMDSLIGRWARDVLTNTRLMLDSPAGEDPIRRRLLEDLETLLVQLVQRSGRAAEERELIDRTLQRTQLLTRLRSGATGT